MQTPLSLAYDDPWDGAELPEAPAYVSPRCPPDDSPYGTPCGAAAAAKPRSCWQWVGRRARQLWGAACRCVPPLMVLPILALLVAGVFFIGAGTLWAIYSPNAADTSLAVLADGATETPCTAGASGVTVNVQVTAVKPAEASAKVSASYVLSPQYRRTLPSSLSLPAGYALTVVVNSVRHTYYSGDVLQDHDASETLTPTSDTTSYGYYPFDSYYATFLVTAYLQYNSTLSALPICVAIGDTLSLFSSTVQLEGAVYPEEVSATVLGNASLVFATAVYRRTATVKFFSVFIVLLMWALSAMIFAIALDIVFLRPREPGPPTIGFFIATLFALPAVRNVQPDAPVIGARVDVVGFFWNMMLVGLAALLLLAALVGYHPYNRRPSFAYLTPH